MGIVPTSIEEIQLNKEENITLDQNYPNPFSGKTVISFRIPENDFVSLKVYNMLGVEIAELAGKRFEAGNHSLEFESGQLPKGKYFYRVESNNFSATRGMTIFE